MRAILTYHSIDDSGSPISVSPAAFRRQLEWLVAERVRVVPLSELSHLPVGSPDPRRRVDLRRRNRQPRY